MVYGTYSTVHILSLVLATDPILLFNHVATGNVVILVLLWIWMSTLCLSRVIAMQQITQWKEVRLFNVHPLFHLVLAPQTHTHAL